MRQKLYEINAKIRLFFDDNDKTDPVYNDMYELVDKIDKRECSIENFRTRETLDGWAPRFWARNEVQWLFMTVKEFIQLGKVMNTSKATPDILARYHDLRERLEKTCVEFDNITNKEEEEFDKAHEEFERQLESSKEYGHKKDSKGD